MKSLLGLMLISLNETVLPGTNWTFACWLCSMKKQSLILINNLCIIVTFQLTYLSIVVKVVVDLHPEGCRRVSVDHWLQ